MEDPVSSDDLAYLNKYERKLAEELGNLSNINLSDDIFDESAHVYGRGGYGDVFKAKCRRHGDIAVAVKRLRVHVVHESREVAKVLLRELRIWSSVQHPNILPLLGYAMRGRYPALISVWMAKGSLRDFMDANPDKAMAHLAKGIASGLLHLHGLDIVHSDLKCDNILLSDFDEPLLSDFGISRFVTSVSISNTSTNANGSTRWMAKEFFRFDSDLEETADVVGHSKETDVWAFGMVLYELLSGRVPFFHLKTDAQVIFELARGHTPSRPKSLCTHEDQELLWTVSQDCWRIIPSDRPEMAAICSKLHGPLVDFLSHFSKFPSLGSIALRPGPELPYILNPYLRHDSPTMIRHDLRLPVPKREMLSLPAFDPWYRCRVLYVTIPLHFGLHEVSLDIKVLPSIGSGIITIGDVLRALHEWFHAPPTLKAWENIEKYDRTRRDSIVRAYEERCLERAVRLGSTVDEEKQKGLMWLDWLGPRTFFGGLRFMKHRTVENEVELWHTTWSLNLVHGDDINISPTLAPLHSQIP